MTTPESFPKIKQAANNAGIDLYSHFFCLMDESHLLVKDVDYRDNIVLPMNDFFLFKQKALVSATPIAFSDPVSKHKVLEQSLLMQTITTNRILH